MTDRELLEAAAKSAGFAFNDQWFDERTGLLVWKPPTNYESRDWNPLTDDGDALRLAVSLRIEYTFSQAATWVQTEPKPLHVEMLHEPHGDDPLAATRRAIVRAAASMLSAGTGA